MEINGQYNLAVDSYIKPASTDDAIVKNTDNMTAIAEVEEELSPINIEEEVESEDEAKGVIKNLLKGHFKGVADIRLRINFNDEIEKLEQAEAEKMLAEGLSELDEFVKTGLEALLESDLSDDEKDMAVKDAVESFSQSLTQMSTDNNNAIKQTEANFSNLTDAIKSAFAVNEEPEEITTDGPVTMESTVKATDTPLETIAMVSTIEAEGQIAVEDAPVTITEIVEFDLDAFLADFIDSFMSKLSELDNSLANINILPEISEPRGNGAAYIKFMTAYNEIRGQIPEEAPPDQIDSIS